MIPEIDDVLRTIVRDGALSGSDVEVVFDAPTTDWAARRNAPTVNMYLYDLREDLRWRERGFREERGPDGAVTARLPPPRHYKLSYLVTAWTQRPEDEHRLLDALLRCFLRYDVLPSHLVGGGLAGDGSRATVTVGLPPPEDRGFADVWSALGGQLKPSLDVVVNAPVETGVSLTVGELVREPAIIQVGDRRRSELERRQLRRPPSGDDGPPTTATPPAVATGGRKPRARKPR